MQGARDREAEKQHIICWGFYTSTPLAKTLWGRLSLQLFDELSQFMSGSNLVPFPPSFFFFWAQAYTGDKEMEPLFRKILQVWLATCFAWIHEQNVIKLQLFLMANAFAEVFQDGCRWSQYPPRHARDPQVGDFSAWLAVVDSRDPVQLFLDNVVTCDIVWPHQDFTHHYDIS